MSLVQKLFVGSIDIIGDIHGEYEALISLINNLGYDLEGNHPENRKLIFVGDLCDRGPNSPEVIKLVKKLKENGNAQVVLGNHELNLLQEKAKDGSGWFFEERYLKDKKYIPFEKIKEDEKKELFDFIAGLPIALENENLRVVHAAWISEEIDKIKEIPLGMAREFYVGKEKEINLYIKDSGILDDYNNEQNLWGDEQENENGCLPFLEATAKYNVIHQMMNPLRVATSGVEKRTNVPFFASHKWRYVERVAWWNEYQEDKPVIIGHYWRKVNLLKEMLNEGEDYIFENNDFNSWHGKNNNVFCIDFSVGGRFVERNKGLEIGTHTSLAALRFPENILVLETGEVIETKNFKKNELVKQIKF